MLKKVRTPKRKQPATGRFAIVASRYNARYVNGMLRAAQKTLQAAGAKTVHTIRVPGAFEIPAVVAKLAGSGEPPAAIICLGVILRGETSHAQHIGEGVSHALALAQIRWQIPIIHEVLLFENEQQAIVRCLSAEHNRGSEAAHTALEMAAVMARIEQAS
ncbi:MAG: 6,7-dimethyl-8-ribityllumazine synthase [Verrucomicrobiota bacterium]